MNITQAASLVRMFSRTDVRALPRTAAWFFRRKVLGKKIPMTAIFAPSYKCACGCEHCMIEGYRRSSPEMSPAEVLKIIDFLADWGVPRLCVIGGEPLDVPGLEAYAARASARGMLVTLDTNGLGLDEARVLSLIKAGVIRVSVSIDSADEAVHDSFRRHPGVWKAACEGVRQCARHGLSSVVTACATKRAIDSGDIERLIGLSRELGADGIKLLWPMLIGRWWGHEEERLSPGHEARVRELAGDSFVYIEDVLSSGSRTSAPVHCAALRGDTVFISPYGDVQPCPSVPVSFGNILKGDPMSVMESLSRHASFLRCYSCSTCMMNEMVKDGKLDAAAREGRLPVAIDELMEK